MTEDIHSARYCDICRAFDVRALLLSAEQAPQRAWADQAGRLASPEKGTVRQGIPHYYKHHQDLATLKSFATTCNLCGTIWREYCRQRQPTELTDVAINEGICKQRIYLGTGDWDTGLSAVPIIVATQLGFPPQSISRRLAVFEACVGESVRVEDRHLLARLQASGSQDEECFRLARTWLDECRLNHASCTRELKERVQFPTRVLAVTESDTIHLVQGADCVGEYTALSYCWGPDRDLVLTAETEQYLRDGHPLSQFPATLKDAITVTRELGVQYIWIDALCIFQDQERPEAKADWAREAGMMRNVYRNAVVTIEAASASRGSEAFLTYRQSSKPYCNLPWYGEHGTAIVCLRPIVDIPDDGLLKSKIFTRGWTLQERMLAPRTLSFGSQQMYFQCANGFLYEAGRSSPMPKGVALYLSKRSMLELRRDRSLAMRWLRSIAHAFKIPAVVTLSRTHDIGWSSQGVIEIPGGYWATYYGYWRGVIENFTERHLMHSEDRLPALSGLADEFQRTTGDTYLCGHWQGELISSLAWTVSQGDDTTYPVATPNNWSSSYAAPSWSWASVHGKVTFFLWNYHIDRNLTELATIQEVSVTPQHHSDPLGKVSVAYLVLKAPLLRIPDPQEQCSPEYQCRALHNHIRQVYLPGATEFHQQHVPYAGQQFALLQLLQEELGTGGRGQGTQVLMLLLESCESGGFRRLCCVNVQIASRQELESTLRLEQTKAVDEPSLNKRDYLESRPQGTAYRASLASEVLSPLWTSEVVTLY